MFGEHPLNLVKLLLTYLVPIAWPPMARSPIGSRTGGGSRA